MNVALNSVATASSISGGQKADKAVDGKTNSRWASAASDPQWLQIDLGSRQNVCKVGLDWFAYASAFSIQVSDDANGWTTLINTSASSNTLQTVTVFGSGRYIRMYGTGRGITSSGYSLSEFQVFTQPSQAPIFTSAAATTFQTGILGNFSVTTSGVPAAVITETGSLPAGVTFTDNGNGTATIAGTPTGSGNTYPVTLTAANGVAPNATQNLTIQVNQPPTITLNPMDQTVQPSTSVSFIAAASGVPTPTVQWQVSTDSGMSFTNIAGATSTTYTLTAQPSQNGYHYRAVFSNGVGSPATTTAATLHVGIAPAVTSADHISFVVGSTGSFTITTSGVPSATLSRTGAQFPAWLTLTDNGDGTGTLIGTPPAGSAGTYQFTLTAANGFSPPASQLFSLFVDDSPVITSADHATFSEGNAGSFTVTTTAGFPTTTTLSETGSLPSGVTFHDNGDGTATLAGAPAAGTGRTYQITITATAVGGLAAPVTQSFTLTVQAPPVITSANHATFSEGNAGSFTVTTTAGNPSTTTITSTGTRPSGVTFTDNGDGTATIAGTPNVGSQGVHTITITASNGITPDATQTFTLTVNAPPQITSVDHATFTVNAAAASTVTTTGSPTASLTATGSLPPGVTFTDNGDGTATLGGTPTSGGSYSFTITASNGVLPDAIQAFTLDVKPAYGGTVTVTGRVGFLIDGVFTPPSPNAAVTFRPEPANGPPTSSVTIDTTGHFSATVIAGPTYRVTTSFTGKGNGVAIQVPDTTYAGGEVLDLTVPLSRITLKVTDQTGAPVSGARLDVGTVISGLPLTSVGGSATIAYTDTTGTATGYLPTGNQSGGGQLGLSNGMIIPVDLPTIVGDETLVIIFDTSTGTVTVPPPTAAVMLSDSNTAAAPNSDAD
jgi:hypothetical protein